MNAKNKNLEVTIKAEHRKLIQSSNVTGTSTSRTELDMFTRFLRNKVRT